MATTQPTHEAPDELREKYRSTLTTTIAAFDGLVQQLRDRPSAPDVLEALRRELHRLQDSAGMYGLTEISRMAARLGERAASWVQDPTLEASQRATLFEHFANALRLAATHQDPVEEGASRHKRRLLLLGLDEATVAAVREESVLHGYDVVAHPLDDVRLAIAEAHPHVMMAAVDEAGQVIAASEDAAIPVVALELAESTRNRVLPGATIFDLEQGVPKLFEMLESLVVKRSQAGATVLVVDDDPSILTIVRYAVESPDVHVVTLDDPGRLEDNLVKLQPSLLLLDIHLRGYNGLALTRSLRWDPRFKGLPIVLFSSDTSPSMREASYEAGADEFLAKPIVAAELSSRLNHRLERHRLARLADGLHPVTGLPSGPRGLRELTAAIARVSERGLPVSVAVIGPQVEGVDEEPGSWHREALRLRRSLPDLESFAHLASPFIAAVFATHADAAAVGLETVAQMVDPRPQGWRAGLVDSLVCEGGDPRRLLRAAEDALIAARSKPDVFIHRWRGDEREIAPDVVIVEDDASLADMMEYAVTSAGYTARRFGTGPEALDALRGMHTGDRRPLMLLDVDLPGLDGHTLHERIRLERPGSFAAVFVTTHATESEQIRALKSGALDYLAKPLNLRILAAKLPSWLGRTTGGE